VGPTVTPSYTVWVDEATVWVNVATVWVNVVTVWINVAIVWVNLVFIVCRGSDYSRNLGQFFKSQKRCNLYQSHKLGRPDKTLNIQIIKTKL